MGEEPKVQPTPVEPVVKVEPQEPTPGVKVEPVVEPVVEPKEQKTFTAEEHQAELDRIAGKVRDEERSKYDREKERVASEIKPQQPQGQVGFFRQQAEQAIKEAELKGDYVDKTSVLINADLMDHIPQVIDTRVQASNATRGRVSEILNKLEKNTQIGGDIKNFRADIENHISSTIPPNMVNEEMVKRGVQYVVGGKYMSGELTTKTVQKPVIDVPVSTVSQKGKEAPLTDEQIKAMKDYGLSEKTVRTGEAERTYGLKKK